MQSQISGSCPVKSASRNCFLRSAVADRTAGHQVCRSDSWESGNPHARVGQLTESMSHPVSAASEPPYAPQASASAAGSPGLILPDSSRALRHPPAGLISLSNAEDLAKIVFAAERFGLVARSGTILSLMSALAKRHFVTSNHSTRVAVWCATMARVLDQPPGEQAGWTVAAMLHDI